MPVLKTILKILLALILGLTAIAVVLPHQIHVERRITINADRDKVVSVLQDFHNFNAWSPWAEFDPQAKYQFSGPLHGVGTQMQWQGNDKVGSGSQKIVRIVSGSAEVKSQRTEAMDRRLDESLGQIKTTLIEVELNFTGWDPSTSFYRVDDAKQGVDVTWIMETDMHWNLIGRFFALFMDKMVGDDYDRGLTKLKTYLEQMPAPAAADPVPTESAPVATDTKAS